LFSIIRENGQSMTSSDAVDIGNGDIQVQFTNVNPSTGEIELRLAGVNKIVEPDWVLLTIERKPMVAVVWLGTFLLMIGFSIAILRRWNETKGAVRDEATA
jgi:cytochrome c-type biogenesis protein CcmF